MNRKRKRKERKDTVVTGMDGTFADKAAIPSGPPEIVSAPSDACGPLEKYRRHVAHLDLPEERKTELLAAVWAIMGSFVDRAFGDDPAQLCRRPVGQNPAEDEIHDSAVVSSSSKQHGNTQNRLSRTFSAKAKGRGQGRR